jgi:hypothetical protein
MQLQAVSYLVRGVLAELAGLGLSDTCKLDYADGHQQEKLATTVHVVELLFQSCLSCMDTDLATGYQSSIEATSVMLVVPEGRRLPLDRALLAHQ